MDTVSATSKMKCDLACREATIIRHNPIVVPQNQPMFMTNNSVRSNNLFAPIGREQVGVDMMSVTQTSPTISLIAKGEQRHRDGSPTDPSH